MLILQDLRMGLAHAADSHFHASLTGEGVLDTTTPAKRTMPLAAASDRSHPVNRRRVGRWVVPRRWPMTGVNRPAAPGRLLD